LISWYYVDGFQIFGEVLENLNNQEHLYGKFREILFADDTSLYLVVDNEYEAANKLNKDVYMDNVIIKEVETHKHLGLTISEDGNWNEHVKNA
jgi:hypothetical protein